MAADVKIDDLIDALELASAESSARLNCETGKVVVVEDHIRNLVEDGGDLTRLKDRENCK